MWALSSLTIIIIMLLPAPAQPLPLDQPPALPSQQPPPYSPTLINLSQRYNMSANSLTEALLLLSGMYISLVQPEPRPIKVGLHAVFTNIFDKFTEVVTEPLRDHGRGRYANRPDQYRLQVYNMSAGSTRSDYAPKDVLKMLCQQVFPKNTVTMFYVNSHLSLRQYNRPAVSYLPKIIESLGLPIISYDTQFSPNAKPKLSIQLAPTMGQMMDVMFAFLRRFGWTHFSFLCTLSSGCQDEISFIRLKIDEYKRKMKISVYGVDMFSYQLLSYVNFTVKANATEVREKLLYELHKDSRINLVHGNSAEVKSILDVAKLLGLTGKDYVWIFTATSLSLNSEFVDHSYPLGSFVIGFNATREKIIDTIKDGVNMWLDALNLLAGSHPDFQEMDFNTGFTCDRMLERGWEDLNMTVRTPLFWKYGEVLYRYLLKSKLDGQLELDEYGVLKANRFFIMNVQKFINTSQVSSSSKNEQADNRPSGRPGAHGSRAPDSSRRPGGAGRGMDEWALGRNGPDEDDDRGTGSSSARNRHLGSRDRNLPLNRDRNPSSPLSRDRPTVSPLFGARSSNSPLSRFRPTGSSLSRDSAQEGHLEDITTDSISEDSDQRSLGAGTTFSSPRLGPRYYNNRNNNPSERLIRDHSLNPVSQDLNDDPSILNSRDKGLKGDTSSSGLKDHEKTFPHDPSFANSTISARSSFSGAHFLLDHPDKDEHRLASTNPSRQYRGRLLGDENFGARQHPSGGPDQDLTGRNWNRWGQGRIQRRDNRATSRSNRRRRGQPIRGQRIDTDPGDLETLAGSPAREVPARRLPRDVQDYKQIVTKIADWDGFNLMIYDITWPGGSSIPPKGKPEKYILKVVTWQEDPHVIYRDMKSGAEGEEKICEPNTIPCTVYNRNKALHRTNGTKDMCCTGLTIDLLKRLGEMLNFDVQLSEVTDGSYGSPLNANLTEWNGMLGMLLNKEADMAIGALSITPERSAAVDFSVPFLQTGITIIVALRQGVISATAFLEPYDYPSWSLILLFSVHATGASIFIFEWLSPYGLNQGKTSYSVHKFSLFRSFWLIWAMLFGASVSTDQPRGIASRFLANIWALFAVVFCASYTANLAAFMITKDTYYDLSGIQDWRLKNPHVMKPPFKFATIANSSTDLNIRKNYKDIHHYMKTLAQTDVKDAIRNLKTGEIHAFIYDSTTLEYEVGKDDGCKLKTVGKRIAETGYGVAFPKRSPWVREVDGALLKLQQNGEIERLQKHWLARACHNKKETGVSSHTLGILNFTSAFVLLGSGVVLGVLILTLEHMYFRFGRKSLKKWDKCGCCSLVSLSMGQSLTFEQSVMEAMDYHKHHRCKDPLCETQLWKVKHDLDLALLKITQLRRQIAYSASVDVSREGSCRNPCCRRDKEASPQQNGTARRRRQQAGDSSPQETDKSVNQPLLALESKKDSEDDDNTPVQSPVHKMSFQPSQRSSLPGQVSKPTGNDSYRNPRYSYPENVRHTDERLGRNERPASRLDSSVRGWRHSDDVPKTISGLDLHPPPPSFDDVMTNNSTYPADDLTTPSSSPSLPTPTITPPPPPAAPSPTNLSPVNGGSPILSDTNPSPSISPPSTEEKRYDPFILDSPESPSFSSFSENSDHQQSPPGTLSKLSDEVLSMAVSQDRDSNFTSSPELPRSADASQLPSPALNYSSNPLYKHNPSPGDIALPLPHSGTPLTLVNPSKEADNDVSRRRVKENENIYVNVDDIAGKETSF